MRDYVFEEILDRRANLMRPTVRLDAERMPHEPEYALVQAALPLRLRPARAALDATLLGAFPKAEAVGYALPGKVQTHDRLGVVQGITVLRDDAEEATSTLSVANPYGIAAGQRLHLREAADCEEVTVAGVDGLTVTLREPLAGGFAAGTNVERVESYEVLGVETAGSGHHLRLGLRRRG
jgi:hypothetical protein